MCRPVPVVTARCDRQTLRQVIPELWLFRHYMQRTLTTESSSVTRSRGKRGADFAASVQRHEPRLGSSATTTVNSMRRRLRALSSGRHETASGQSWAPR